MASNIIGILFSDSIGAQSKYALQAKCSVGNADLQMYTYNAQLTAVGPILAV